MRQGLLEGDDGYIRWARQAIERLIFTGGRNLLCSPDIMEAADQANPSQKETTSEEEKYSVINLLQTSDPVRCENLNKQLQNGSYVVRVKYLTTSGGAYELMVHRSVRYQSIRNGGNGGGMVNSNGRGNQHNQRENVMLLQQDSNGGSSNGCVPEYQILPGKDISTFFL